MDFVHGRCTGPNVDYYTGYWMGSGCRGYYRGLWLFHAAEVVWEQIRNGQWWCGLWQPWPAWVPAICICVPGKIPWPCLRIELVTYIKDQGNWSSIIRIGWAWNQRLTRRVHLGMECSTLHCEEAQNNQDNPWAPGTGCISCEYDIRLEQEDISSY